MIKYKYHVKNNVQYEMEAQYLNLIPKFKKLCSVQQCTRAISKKVWLVT